ncbi:MAG: LytR family transcriptional regulator [Jatrophihabitans sp.]|nr:MAG: LytR family transcriptional regulator [Jatrophihabitans sp.]
MSAPRSPRGAGLPPLPPELDPTPRRRSPGRARRVTLTTCAALSVLLLVLSGTYWWKYRQFSTSLERVDISAVQTAGSGSGENILVTGNDDRTDMTPQETQVLHTGTDGGSLNTDTIMIIHIPAGGARATLVSIPRDSYVDIPGYRKDKINAAYPDAYTATHGTETDKRQAGARLLTQTVEHLTGVRIDHYAQVDLLGFYRISNALGGVPVDMCTAVQEPKSGIDLHQGVNVIQGVQALAFVRQRYGYPNGLGDLDRVKRQQYFLTAAFRKVVSAGVLLNPFKLQDLLKAVQSSLFVDAGLDPLALGRQLQNLTANNIAGRTIPTDGFADTGVGSVVVVHPDQVQAFMRAIDQPPATPSPATAPPARPPAGGGGGPTPGSPTTPTATGTAPDAGCIY